MRKVAALFVVSKGIYFESLAGVEPWDIGRDARKYDGPYPIVAHPTCKRWGSYWSGGPIVKVRKLLGSDDGCFQSAMILVRKYGGVIEHPEKSQAWKVYNLNRPPRKGGWIKADNKGGYTCYVEQGHYDHPSCKPTWLYAFGMQRKHLPELIWGYCDSSTKVKIDNWSVKQRKEIQGKLLDSKGREHTPILFRDALIDIARSVYMARDIDEVFYEK